MRRRWMILTLAAAAAAALAAAALALGAIPGTDGKIDACIIPNQAVRIVDDPARCNAEEQLLQWNQQGPKGDAGPAGAAGAPGAPGAPGASAAGGPDASLPVSAADAFIDVDGIKGESVDAKHAGQIDVLAWSFGASQSGSHASGGGGGAGKVSFHDLHFTHAIDKASPALFVACASGKHIKKAVLYVRRKSDKFEYLKVTLEDVLVSSVNAQTQGAGASGPIEDVGLDAAKITVEYTPQKPDGGPGPAAKGGWDVKSNKKL